ncbi:MAG: hypothetical protein KKE76_09685 [Gammaproteobacteria bacterium]|nr:hypothetical protein [Gammaproteobacteria bacterium]
MNASTAARLAQVLCGKNLKDSGSLKLAQSKLPDMINFHIKRGSLQGVRSSKLAESGDN